MHGAGDGEEIIAIETVVMEDEAVKAEIAKLELPEGTVVMCDPWIYGIFAPRIFKDLVLTCILRV